MFVDPQTETTLKEKDAELCSKTRVFADKEAQMTNEFVAEKDKLQRRIAGLLQCVACRVLQCVAVCCSVLQCVAVCCSVLQCVAVCCSMLQYVAVCFSVLQCVAVRCRALQCVATR